MAKNVSKCSCNGGCGCHDKSTKCHDCGCREGEFHVLGCDMERCPFCGGQLISCECIYEKLGIDTSEGSYAYTCGLTDEQYDAWDELLLKKGRIIFGSEH